MDLSSLRNTVRHAGGHVAPLVANRAVTGGLSDQAFLKHRFAGIDGSGILFGRKPREWNRTSLRKHLDSHAIEYAVFESPAWVAVAREHPDLFEPMRSVNIEDRLFFRVVDPEPSLVLEGSAKVVASYDRITISEIATPRLVLKLHYSKHFVVDGEADVRPINHLDDPIPFLEVVVPEDVADCELIFTANWF